MQVRALLLQKFAAAACAMALPLTTLAAQPRPSADGNLMGTATLTGTCQRLIIAGDDSTSRCRGLVGNTAYRSGRSGFTFFVEGEPGLVVTFSGADGPAQGDQAAIALDKVIFTPIRPQRATTELRATGRCTYTNPYIGSSRIDCSASTDDGRYSGTFVSDGRPPATERF